MVGKKYSAQFKIQMVEEYLKETEQNKISIASFAFKKGISDSTFNDWVIKYKRQGKGFCNITSEIIKLNELEVAEYETKPQVFDGEIINKVEGNVCRIYYNNAIVEFDIKNIERVLKILRTW